MLIRKCFLLDIIRLGLFCHTCRPSLPYTGIDLRRSILTVSGLEYVLSTSLAMQTLDVGARTLVHVPTCMHIYVCIYIFIYIYIYICI